MSGSRAENIDPSGAFQPCDIAHDRLEARRLSASYRATQARLALVIAQVYQKPTISRINTPTFPSYRFATSRIALIPHAIPAHPHPHHHSPTSLTVHEPHDSIITV